MVFVFLIKHTGEMQSSEECFFSFSSNCSLISGLIPKINLQE